MRANIGTRATFVAVLAPLIAALAYSQYGWRRDHAVAERLNERIVKYTKEQGFPVDGEDVAASALRVIRGADTIALGEVLRGSHSRVIYFTRPDCAPCKWLGAQMDSINPRWQAEFVVIEPFRRNGRVASGLMLDSVSTLALAGVPATLSIDTQGFVRHSALGLGRVVRLLNLDGIPSPSADLIGAYKDSVRATVAK